MQVNCPNCGEKVTAENINIQKMTAVCAACDTVFSIDLPEPKAKPKRRKVKQPDKLTLRDAETLQMDFWTNFRLERNEGFVSSVLGGIIMTFTALLLASATSGELPPAILLMFLLAACAFFYGAALIAVNKTHIEMDEDAITVKRKPIPNPFTQGFEVSLAGVAAIKYEETAASKKEGYDTPRFRVFAETEEGSRRTIVDDVTDDYAIFIAQHLEERLNADADPDVSRLEESGQHLDDEMDLQELVRASQNKVRQ